MTSEAVEEVMRGLSGTQRNVIAILAGRQFYPSMLNATKDKLLRLGLAEPSLGTAIRLTDLGRAVAQELQKRG